MADDHSTNDNDPMKVVWFLVALIGGMIVIWWMQGGPQKADLRGIFLAPPPPLGTGEVYGPEIGTTTYEYQYNYQQ